MMQQRILPFLFYLSFFLLGSSRPMVSRQHDSTKKHCPSRIDLSGGVITIDGKEMKDLSLENFRKVLGKESRKSKLANTIYTYDECGILLYETPGTGVLNEMQVHFRKDHFKFDPHKIFEGTFSLEGKVLEPGTSFDELRKQFPEYHFDESNNDPKGIKEGMYIIFDGPEGTSGMGSANFGKQKE